jgi:hypothetical protein
LSHPGSGDIERDRSDQVGVSPHIVMKAASDDRWWTSSFRL